jgi:hypothetical protein
MDVIIVGAGMAGLSAARELKKRGRSVLLLDKGRGVGGRMATRRLEGARFDTGAQFFSARSAPFRELLKEELLPNGTAQVWYRRKDEPYYRGEPSMTGVPKLLAQGLEIRSSTRVIDMEAGPKGWRLTVESADGPISGSSLLLTSPVPQTLDLLAPVASRVDQETLDLLESIVYDPALALLLLLEGASPVPEPGYHRPEGSEKLYWVADNHRKGISPEPAITVHATASYSRRRYDDAEEEVSEELLSAFRELYGDKSGWFVRALQLKKWRYARPSNPTPERSYLLTPDGKLPPAAVAGDAFGGPRVEGAFLSGLAAAELLDSVL